MAYPTPVLVGSIVETASDGSINIPNTTPPVVGDLLVAFIAGYQSGGSRNIGSTPSGWTLRQSLSGDDNPIACFTKVATSGDVSAGSFTFTLSSTADVFSGAIVKLSNTASLDPVAGSEIDTGTTSYTATTSLTATSPESLILAFYVDAQNTTGAGTLSTYVSSPSLTWSEILDLPGNSGAPSQSFAIASAQTSTTTITSRGATQSNTPAQAKSIALLANGLMNATGTNTLHSVSPTHFNQAGICGTTGTNATFEVSPTIPTQSGDALQPTTWTTITKS